MQICSAIRAAIGPAITPALLSAFCGSKAARPFADTVASWFDGGAPGRFVPTYRDWQTSGALFQDSLGTTLVTALEQFVGLNLDRSRNLARGPEMATVSSVTGVPAGGPALTQYPIASALVVGRMYEITATVVGLVGSLDVGFTGGSTAFAAAPSANRVRSTNGLLAFKFTAATTAQTLFTRDVNTANFTNISIKEIYGQHRIQSTSTARPILTARKNRYDNSAWQGGGTPTGWTMAGGTGTSVPNGTIDGNVILRQTAVAQRPFLQPPSITGAVGQVFTNSARSGTIYSGSLPLSSFVNWVAGTGNGTQAWSVNGVPALPSDLVPADSVVAVAVTFTVAGTMQPRAGVGTGTVATCDMDVSRPMLTFGGVDQMGRYQRTGLTATVAADYDAVSFPVGLRYDGIDDWNVTAGNVDFSGTNKVTVAMAVRKLSDASIGLMMELGVTSASTPGTFGLFGPGGPGNGNFSWRSMGTVSGVLGSVGTFPAPVNAIVRAIADIAAPNNTIWVNGVSVTTSSDRGTGNFASFPIYYGRRGGTGLSFDGIEYGDLVIGNLRTTDEMAYIDQEFAKNFSEAL